ncbi:glycosyltransferase [Paracoccus saliphilus]|uniref:Glycosyltransferase family 2 protein n=1 Tax=Paracoccus saliphilus TaxID=405559 RepID=A0AA46A7X8_9RHOB|nr:glycosyltransferase [Paracoccus saliphilus]WCR05502.1 glycosyltransferase family 2 protein [Paracoccus saliphilus]SIT18872.1 Glycosyltransferase involved in cell wall bisynthesis [Paracoccus saliphilus]
MTWKNSYGFVIPSYNDANGIARHLDFFSRQEQEIELIIVDDHSDDNTQEVINTATLPSNIKLNYIRLEKNSGPAVARNIGAGEVQTEFMMFIDADDVIQDCFFDYIKISPLHAGADFILIKYHLSSDPEETKTYDMHTIDNAFFSSLGNSGFPNKVFSLAEIPHVLKTINFPWNKVYKTSFYKASGISFPDLRMHEDIPPHWMSFLKAKRFGVLAWAPPLITHFESITGNRATNYIGEHRMHLFPLLEKIGRDIVDMSQEQEVVVQFKEFSEDLFDWLVNTVCNGSGREQKFWRDKYKKEIDKVHKFIESI